MAGPTFADKESYTEQEASQGFFKQMVAAGEERSRLKDEVVELRSEVKRIQLQNDGLRGERDIARRELNAALKGKNAPLALDSDEEWLFSREATLKFGNSASGKRILVLRCRSRKIIRSRDTITPEHTTSALLRAVLEQARRREDGRGTYTNLTKRALKDRKKKADRERKRKVEEQQKVAEAAAASDGSE